VTLAAHPVVPVPALAGGGHAPLDLGVAARRDPAQRGGGWNQRILA